MLNHVRVPLLLVLLQLFSPLERVAGASGVVAVFHDFEVHVRVGARLSIGVDCSV